MKAILLVSTALAGLMLASAVYAQTATGTGTSNSTSNSGASSGAQGVVGPQGNAINAGTSNSNSGSNATSNTRARSNAQSSGNANAQNINFNSPGNTTSNNTSNVTGGTSNTNRNSDAVSYSGGTNNSSYNRNDGDVTVRTTPTVYAPPVSGGNPCTLAVSGGVSVIGWGAAAGGTFVDQDCANRQKIAMIHNSGRADLAFALMCNDRDTYYASKRTAAPCMPNPAFDPPGSPPMATQQPGPVVVTPTPVQRVAPVAAKEYPRCDARRGITDNCRS